jgi:hypothetical protein
VPQKRKCSISMPTKLESTIEKRVRRWVEEEEKGIWIKLLADGRKGIPDNLILLPPIIIDRFEFPVNFMVELKRRHGGVVSPHQEKWIKDLHGVAQPAFVAYSLNHVKDIAQFCKDTIRRRVLGPKADLD